MESSNNIYEQQKRNRRTTILIISLFILFFCFLGYGFDLFYFDVDPFGILGEPNFGFPIATFIAAIIGCATAAWSWRSGAKAVLSSAQAYPVPENDEQYKVLRNVVEEMAIASGLPK